MATIEHITTAEQLLGTPGVGRCELVRGELVMMTPAGYQHGRIVSRISSRLAMYVEQRGLGEVTGAETGFQISRDPDTVRAPDVAFVGAARVPATPPAGYFQGAPDLAVEVVSPNDRPGDVLAKVGEWLAAGCRVVWVVDPQTRTVSEYGLRSGTVLWGVSDALSGGEVVPGFAVPVSEIFG